MQTEFAAPVREAVRATLQQGICDPHFRRSAERALEVYPYILHPRGSLRAAKLTLGSFQAAGGSGPAGIAVAGAMEMMTAALHLFDGVADRDADATPAGLQVAIALQFLMGHALEQAMRARPVGAPEPDWGPVYALFATVCAGQQRDIDLQGESQPTLEDAKVMTLQKTGAYGEALALAGAIAAGAGPEIRADLALLGQYMGVRGQLVDDASDASTAAPTTSDIALRKKTLPVVFFLNGRGDSPAYDALRDRYLSGPPLSVDEERQIRQAIDETGAAAFALTLGAWYRMKATVLTQTLASRGCSVELLREYIAEVDPSSPGTIGSGGSVPPSSTF